MWRLQIPTGRNRSRDVFARDGAELQPLRVPNAVLTRYESSLGAGPPLRSWVWSGEEWRAAIGPALLWYLVREPGLAVLLATRCALTAALFALAHRRGHRQTVPAIETWAGVLPSLLLCRDYHGQSRRWCVQERAGAPEPLGVDPRQGGGRERGADASLATQGGAAA